MAGVCQPFVIAQGSHRSPYAQYGSLALDTENVYWTDARGVASVPLSGGPPGQITLYPGVNAGIVVGGAAVYWTTVDLNVVSRAPKVARTVTPESVAFNEPMPYFVAVDETRAYWTANGAGTVRQAPLDGGAPSSLVVNENDPFNIAVDEGYVYWTNPGEGTVKRVSKGVGAPATLASNQLCPSALAVDAVNVYWATGSDGTVMKRPLSGGAPVQLAAGPLNLLSIAVDDRYVYWALSTIRGELQRVPIAGGPITTIAVACPPAMCVPDQQDAAFVAVDDAAVYWTTATDIVKVVK
jgi:hypothetical protein